MNPRKSWHAYFSELALKVAERSTCTRGSVGVILVKNQNIIASGYNGSLPGLPHCIDVGCILTVTTHRGKDSLADEYETNCIRVLHAEQNAIAQAAKLSHATAGAVAYSTHSPCPICFKLLLASGVECIYYRKPYKLSKLEPFFEDEHVSRTILKHIPGDE